VIEVETGTNPIEDWLKTQDDIIDLLQSQDMTLDSSNNHYNALELLRSMMPDYETAEKMLK
jgi:exonuclease VII small subunit